MLQFVRFLRCEYSIVVCLVLYCYVCSVLIHVYTHIYIYLYLRWCIIVKACISGPSNLCYLYIRACMLCVSIIIISILLLVLLCMDTLQPCVTGTYTVGDMVCSSYTWGGVLCNIIVCLASSILHIGFKCTMITIVEVCLKLRTSPSRMTSCDL